MLSGRLGGLANVLLTEPLGYATFARLLKRSYMVITESGGVQDEASALDKPVLVLRETTERMEASKRARSASSVPLPDRIVAEGVRLLDDPVA